MIYQGVFDTWWAWQAVSGTVLKKPDQKKIKLNIFFYNLKLIR